MTTTVKTCFKCNVEQPVENFYRHPKMKDGTVGKCKECNKADVRENRFAKVEYYRAYDVFRFKHDLVRRANTYSTTKRLIDENPVKYKARLAVGNAIRAKRLLRQPCEVCGSEIVHAHHDDYSKPLSVRWLCPSHHAQWHKINTTTCGEAA